MATRKLGKWKHIFFGLFEEKFTRCESGAKDNSRVKTNCLVDISKIHPPDSWEVMGYLVTAKINLPSELRGAAEELVTGMQTLIDSVLSKHGVK
jgi:hypothetical protein